MGSCQRIENSVIFYPLWGNCIVQLKAGFGESLSPGLENSSKGNILSALHVWFYKYNDPGQ